LFEILATTAVWLLLVVLVVLLLLLLLLVLVVVLLLLLVLTSCSTTTTTSTSCSTTTSVVCFISVVADLPITPSRDWLHMDQVESDKLSWMKDLPTPSAGDSKVC